MKLSAQPTVLRRLATHTITMPLTEHSMPNASISYAVTTEYIHICFIHPCLLRCLDERTAFIFHVDLFLRRLRQLIGRSCSFRVALPPMKENDMRCYYSLRR